MYGNLHRLAGTESKIADSEQTVALASNHSQMSSLVEPEFYACSSLHLHYGYHSPLLAFLFRP